jgi:penicillin-binding protein 1A
VVAAEDATFFEHRGVDYRGMLRAAVEDLLRGRFAQGGSTITQQVIKQLLLTPEKTVRRKVQEIILARRISEHLTKEEVLTIYLNHSYFGHGRYGCEEAARFYFGKSVSDIDAAEAALLAGIVQRPERLSPHKHPEAAKRRQSYVLGQMSRLGFLDHATAEKLVRAPIVVVPESAAKPGFAPEAVSEVIRLLSERAREKGGGTTSGLTVRTTIDWRLQDLARQAVERGLEEVDERQGFRGPSGHRAGAALERHRAMLEERWKGKLDPGDIAEGIVVRVDRGGGAPPRLVVDVGGKLGAVDLGAEPRYGRGGGKPLADRWKAGDLVRVRAAPERARGGGRKEGEDEADGDAEALLPLALELGPQAAMVVMIPRSREVLALVGGYGYRPGGFDRSLKAVRQPGSAFKPFVFAAAIDEGAYTAASIVNDAPEVYDLWKPQNYDKEAFRGPIRLRTALAHSVNTVAIKLLADIGLPEVRELAGRAGITTPQPESLGLSMALGAGSVTPIELCNAFATFPGGGAYLPPRFLTAVGSENVAVTPGQPSMRPETAFVLVSLMRSVTEEGTARAAGAKLRRPIAGKTGTSNDGKDAWFVGFSPDLIAAVWVGFDDGRRLGQGETGARTALPIWIDFMSKALADQQIRDFDQPPGIVVAPIDPATGLRAAPGSVAIDEVFIEGTAPAEVAPAQGEEGNADKILLERN